MTESQKRVILVAVQESEHSFHALETALDLFFVPFQSNPQYSLFIVHARPNPSTAIAIANGLTSASIVYTIMATSLQKAAERIVSRCKRICADKSVEFRSIEAVEGDPKYVVQNAVKKYNASILVLGSDGHTRGAFMRFFSRSLSSYLSQTVSCSVMIIKK